MDNILFLAVVMPGWPHREWIEQINRKIPANTNKEAVKSTSLVLS